MSSNYGSTDATSNHDTETSEDLPKTSNFRRALPQFCVVGVKNLILLGWGLILGYPTILIPGLQSKFGDNSSAVEAPEFTLTAEDISWIGSINLLCVPLGSLTSGALMDPIGKRRLMQILNLPMLAAWALFYFAKDISQVYIGLCLSGMSGGLLEAPLLIYIAETVEPQYRGMLTASGTATVLGGVCLQFIIGSVLHWKVVAAISAVVPFLAFNAVFLVPESPYWLFSKNRVEEAHASLCWLRGWVPFTSVEQEFQQIVFAVEENKAQKKALQLERQNPASRIKPFKKRGFIAPFFLIFAGFIFGHFSGMTPLQTYAIPILSSYKVPINEYYATIFLGAAQVLGCLLGMAIVRTTGKRKMVFLSFIGCGICFSAVAGHSYLTGKGNVELQQMHQTSSTHGKFSSSIANLELNVMTTVKELRENIDREQINKMISLGREIVGPHIDTDKMKETVEIGKHIVDVSGIDAEILSEVLQLSMHIVNPNDLSSLDEEKFKEFLEISGLLLAPSLSAVDTDTLNMMLNSSAAVIDPNINDIDMKKVSELVAITDNIVTNMLPKESPLMKSLTQVIADFENDLDDAIKLNKTIPDSQIIHEMDELSAMLASLRESLRESALPSKFDTDTDYTENKDNDYSWAPLILLLAGSLFAHSGAKLFPWMLIGEVYPMEVRGAAAGISSAVGYLVGFSSNKLFLGMVATFTLNGTFLFYSAVALIGCLILYFILPETENKTLLEIEAYFDKSKREKLQQSTSSANQTNAEA